VRYTCRVEGNIDPPFFIDDILQMTIKLLLLQSIYNRHFGFPANPRDLIHHLFQLCLCAASQEYFCAFQDKRSGNGGANGT
jgi:hypothetical protein